MLRAKSTKSKTLDLPEIGTHTARLVGLVDMGHQPGFEWNGKEIESSYQIEYTYELPNSLTKDGKPHWVSEQVKVNDFEGKGITSTMMYRFRVLDPANKGEDGKDLTSQLGNPCMVTLSAHSSGYPKIKGQAAVGSIPLGMQVPELVNNIFIFSNPQVDEEGEVDVDLFYSFPEFKQDRIKSALDFETSKLFKALAEEDNL